MADTQNELKLLREQIAEDFQEIHEALGEVVETQSSLAGRMEEMATSVDVQALEARVRRLEEDRPPAA